MTWKDDGKHILAFFGFFVGLSVWVGNISKNPSGFDWGSFFRLLIPLIIWGTSLKYLVKRWSKEE